MLNEKHWRLTYTRHFVEALGFRIGLDFDDSLLIDAPAEPIDPARLVALLKACPLSLAQELRDDARRKRSHCVGGPFNGQRYGHVGGWRHWVAMRGKKRGQWSAYWIADPYGDARAFYCGPATSERAARELACRVGPRLQPDLNPYKGIADSGTEAG